VCEEVGFMKLHIFPFSARKTTPAATMPDQVPPQIKADRAARLAELENKLRARYLDSLVGRKLQVLVESTDEATQRSQGTSCRYATVELAGNHAEGTLVPVRITTARTDALLGE
jgi:threonylcarbamoyladenosine tRNA methylthiotransferase MtaB